MKVLLLQLNTVRLGGEKMSVMKNECIMNITLEECEVMGSFSCLF